MNEILIEQSNPSDLKFTTLSYKVLDEVIEYYRRHNHPDGVSFYQRVIAYKMLRENKENRVWQK